VDRVGVLDVRSRRLDRPDTLDVLDRHPVSSSSTYGRLPRSPSDAPSRHRPARLLILAVQMPKSSRE
jgi:hypothetical protein